MPNNDLEEATPWLDSGEQQVWRRWLVATAQLYRYLDEGLRPHGIDLAEYDVLVHLSEAEDHRLRMGELAGQVHLSRSRLTHTVSRMESQGVVLRRTASHDRRGVVAVLTDEGMALIESVAAHHVRAVRRAFIDAIGRKDLMVIDRSMAAVIAATDPASGPPDH
ncbi:MarR family winged helix-turn-helix transcriptional regulator [Acidipropionibacterium virtanenii]|nr:MarR family transcriptional regulator [Acidipropionibacterium virtanenii]